MVEDKTQAPQEQQEDSEPNPKSTVDYWKRWLKAAKKGAQTHWDDTAAAEAEYNKSDVRNEQGALDHNKALEKSYPAYTVACKTMESAFYARTPDLTTSRAFGISDEDALDACELAENIGDIVIKANDFDSVIDASVWDFMHGHKAAPQVVYQEVKTMRRQTLSVQTGDDGQAFLYDDARDAPFDGEAEAFEGEDGNWYYEVEDVEKKVLLKELPTKDYLHTPEAKSESEIREKAYRFCLSKEECISRFGEKARAWPYKSGKSYTVEERDKDRSDVPGFYLEGWEIWCLDSKKRYPVSEDIPEFLEEPEDDPYNLAGFFPSPKHAITGKPSDSLFPTPIYIHLYPTICQLHESYGKIFRLIKTIRRRSLIDGASPELIAAARDLSDNEFISVAGLQNLVEKGGIGNMVHTFPVQEFVAAIKELTELQGILDGWFDKWFGTPDIIRGESVDPREAFAKTSLRTGNAHDRFRRQKAKIEKLVRDTIELLIDLWLRAYRTDRATAARMTGFAYGTPEEQARFNKAFDILDNDKERLVRIEIETDSTSFVDDNLKMEKAKLVSETVLSGLAQIAQIAESSPDDVPVALSALLCVLDAMPGGRERIEEVKASVQKRLDALANPPEPGPPPPDYEAMKLDIMRMKAEGDIQVKMRELERREFESQMKAQTAQFQEMLAERDQSLKEQMAAVTTQLEQARLELDRYATILDEREKLIEENRLAMIANGELEQEGGRGREVPAPTTVVINNPPAVSAPEPVIIPNIVGGI